MLCSPRVIIPEPTIRVYTAKVLCTPNVDDVRLLITPAEGFAYSQKVDGGLWRIVLPTSADTTPILPERAAVDEGF